MIYFYLSLYLVQNGQKTLSARPDLINLHREQPKDRRKRVGGHDPSVKLPKRQFAVQDNAVEHVEVGGAAEQSVRPRALVK
jgi:hypothetical protein